MVRTLLSLSAVAAICIAASAPAQSAGGHPDPLDAAASTPKAQYESAIRGYRRLGDTKPTPWTEANETVKRIGGGRADAREANTPAAPASAPATPSARTTGADPNKPAADQGSHKH